MSGWFNRLRGSPTFSVAWLKSGQLKIGRRRNGQRRGCLISFVASEKQKAQLVAAPFTKTLDFCSYSYSSSFRKVAHKANSLKLRGLYDLLLDKKIGWCRGLHHDESSAILSTNFPRTWPVSIIRCALAAASIGSTSIGGTRTNPASIKLAIPRIESRARSKSIMKGILRKPRRSASFRSRSMSPSAVT